MVKTIVEALEGYEDIYELVNQKVVNFEARKAEAIEKAIAEVEERFAEERGRLERALAEVSVTKEIEVEDEVEPEVPAEETSTEVVE